MFSVPRRFPGASGFGNEEVTSGHLDTAGVQHIRLNDPETETDLNRLKAFGLEAIFRQSHWQADLPPVFRTENLMFTRQYYVPNAIAPLITSGGGIINHTRKDLLERQFIASATVSKIMCEHDRLGGARMTVSGHPKVQEVQSAVPSWPIRSGNATRVIWSAHHAIWNRWNKFGVFLHVYDDMLDLARRRTDIDFLFSPHPGLLTQFENMKPKRRHEVEAFMAAWDALPNTGMILDGQYRGPFKASDLLIVDGISLLMEYQLLKKPVIQLSRPDHSPWNALGKLVAAGSHELPMAQIDELEALIEGQLDGRVAHKDDAQQRLIDELKPKGDPARLILDTIYTDVRVTTGPRVAP